MAADNLGLTAIEAAMLTYLVPPAIAALMLRSLSGRIAVFALATLTGTMVHELLHAIVGALTGARPISMSLFPRRSADGRGYVMGSVTFENLTWYNAAPACLAPLLGLPLLAFVAWLRVNGGWHFEALDILLWALLAPQFLTCWPSSTDLRLSLLSWPIYLAAGAIAWFVWFPHP
ncbi:hypothetical protein BSFA1_82060 (plasmid) [Burkholderia sp. SFA1]|nr:hypothetical protein BSFA1_82060 [Burkholderia sp. SFA1]